MELLSWRFWNSQLQRPTSVLGLKLWVVVGICAGAFLFLLLFLLPLCLSSRRRRRRRADDHPASSIPLHKLDDFKAPKVVHKEIPGVIDPPHGRQTSAAAAAALVAPQTAAAKAEIQIDIRRQERGVVVGEQQGHSSHGGSSRHAKHGASSAGTSGETHRSSETASMGRGGRVPEVSHLGWGHWYTLRELEEATGGLSPENVIGEGGYGIVYRGVLADDTTVAVKNLLNNRGQAEKEFKVEVEAIGRVRHKNLVRLLGYCVEGAYRMLVYEYLDNGNLNQWLHGDVGKSSPLSWDARMNIILGTAKGLAYLHEGLEPKVVHRDVKSSNILLDEQWNPKVSDFGLAKLLRSETNHVTTRVMGTFGYVAPEYASTGMLTERSDVYSFGVLVMEIISGRAPVDFTRPPVEIHLVEWLKMMVGEWKSDEVLDPRIPDRPSSKALKRALLVALRCVDPEARKRPKIGHVIHMFETDDLLLRDDRKIAQAEPGWQRDYSKRTLGRHNSNAVEASRNHDQEKWR